MTNREQSGHPPGSEERPGEGGTPAPFPETDKYFIRQLSNVDRAAAEGMADDIVAAAREEYMSLRKSLRAGDPFPALQSLADLLEVVNLSKKEEEEKDDDASRKRAKEYEEEAEELERLTVELIDSL